MAAETTRAQRPSGRMWGRVAAVWIVILVAFAALIEGAARLVVPSLDDRTLGAWRRTMEVLGVPAINEAATFDPYLFWALKPNLRGLRVTGTSPEGDSIDFAFSTNALGLRGPEVAPKGQCLRVLALGDSCTFGLGVNDADTWPAQLQRMLDEFGGGTQWDVINAGVYGYSAFQGLRYLQSKGFALEPDVVIVQFWANDAERWSMSDREAARRLALTQWERPLMRSRFYCWLKLTMQHTNLVRILAPDGPMVRESPEEFAQSLRAIRDACHRRGVKTAFVVWPVREQWSAPFPRPNEYQRIIEEVARGAGSSTAVLNLFEVFARAETSPYLDPVHANPEGCRLMAEEGKAVLGTLYSAGADAPERTP